MKRDSKDPVVYCIGITFGHVSDILSLIVDFFRSSSISTPTARLQLIGFYRQLTLNDFPDPLLPIIALKPSIETRHMGPELAHE